MFRCKNLVEERVSDNKKPTENKMLLISQFTFHNHMILISGLMDFSGHFYPFPFPLNLPKSQNLLAKKNRQSAVCGSQVLEILEFGIWN